jgi:hypothetical protein
MPTVPDHHSTSKSKDKGKKKEEGTHLSAQHRALAVWHPCMRGLDGRKKVTSKPSKDSLPFQEQGYYGEGNDTG